MNQNQDLGDSGEFYIFNDEPDKEIHTCDLQDIIEDLY